MDRRKFIKNVGNILGVVVTSNVMLGCTDSSLFSNNEVDNIDLDNSLHQTLLHYIRNGQNIGYFELYPNIFRQPRIIIIADNYSFVKDKKKREYFLASTILSVETLAIVKCNFDIYKTQVTIDAIHKIHGKTADNGGYLITTEVADQEIYFKLFSEPMKIDYPIRVLGSEGGNIRLYPDFSLPCIMSKQSFREFIKNYKDKKQLKLG